MFSIRTLSPSHLAAGVVSACLLLAVSQASASPLSVTKSNGNFIPGTGIPGDGFTVSDGADGEQVSLKGEGAFSLDGVLGVSGNRYFMKTGLNSSSSAAPGQATWNVNFQYSPGTGTPAADTLILQLDFDPGFGSTSFVTLAAPIQDADTTPDSWDDVGDSFISNPQDGSWSDDVTPFVVANSYGLHEGFWSGFGGYVPFDPDAVGEYEFRLSALSGSTPLLSASIFIETVPEPATLALFGFGLAGLGVMRRRRRR